MQLKKSKLSLKKLAQKLHLNNLIVIEKKRGLFLAFFNFENRTKKA